MRAYRNTQLHEHRNNKYLHTAIQEYTNPDRQKYYITEIQTYTYTPILTYRRPDIQTNTTITNIGMQAYRNIKTKVWTHTHIYI